MGMDISLMMLDLLSQDCSLQELIDKATELLGNPMILTDNRFRVLYSSRNVKGRNPYVEKCVGGKVYLQ